VLVVEAGDYTQFRIGESIPPEAMHLFQTLGIDQKFLSDGHAPCYGNCSYWGSDKRGYNDTVMNPLGHGWHLDRVRFNRLMATQARELGVELIVGARLTASSPAAEGTGFVLQLAASQTGYRSDATVQADFVADASGASAVFARQRGSRKTGDSSLVCLAMRFSSPDHQGTASGLTHLEAVEQGWWYGAQLPDASLLLAFYSDADIVKAHRLQKPERWKAWLAAAPNTAALVSGLQPSIDGVLSFPAPSYCLDRVHGDGWLAVGDAASAHDPVTSHGIVKSIANGMAAADVIAGRIDAQHYAASIAQQYQRYLKLRQTCYGWEQRWPAAPFWRTRHATRPA
jgi:flavin-dependent dehydrogenase